MEVINLLKKTGLKPNIIFDVGANIGVCTRAFRQHFPSARVFAFEPVTATFDRMKETVVDDPLVETNKMALGKEAGTVLMRAVPSGVCNRIIQTAQHQSHTETVEIQTGNAFCQAKGIKEIDFLKIDTEGFDLDVLIGFNEMLRAKQIKYLQVECGIHPKNKEHVHFEAFTNYLCDLDYGFIAITDSVRHDTIKKKATKGVWYCNLIFAAED